MNKEMDELRKKQEIAKAAELKAKLDMVRQEKKPSYGRSHRKIGELLCDTGIKTGYTNATMKFVLRLDSHSGEFIAEHGDIWYVSKSRDALKVQMDAVAKVTLDLKWTRYIKVEYKAMVPYRNEWSSTGSTTNLEIDDKRGDKPILGIELTWEIVEYSNPIRLPGEDDERYMFREVEDGIASKAQTTVKELPPGVIIYTKEREQLMEEIREAFARIDKKMCELLGGTPEQIAKRLDSVTGTFLLAAPKEKKR